MRDGVRFVGRGAKWVLANSTFDRGDGPRRFGDYLADRWGFDNWGESNPAREFAKRYPPPAQWQKVPRTVTFKSGVWEGSGPIARDRLYLSMFRFVLPHDPVEGIFEEYVFQQDA